MKNKLAQLVVGDYCMGFGNWNNRCTGKSTARALQIISEAMLSPGTKVQIYEDGYSDSINRRTLFVTVQNIVNKLELKLFKVQASDFTITYDLFESDLESMIRKIVREELND